MQSANASRLIDATPSTIWALVRDVTTIASYHPAVETAELLSENPTGLGAARRCNFYDGTNVREEVTELDEERRLRFTLSEFTMPMHRLEAEMTLEPADGGCLATFEIFFEPKFGIVGKLMGEIAIKRQLRSVCAAILAGLDHHLATAEVVGRDFKPSPAVRATA